MASVVTEATGEPVTSTVAPASGLPVTSSTVPPTLCEATAASAMSWVRDWFSVTVTPVAEPFA